MQKIIVNHQPVLSINVELLDPVEFAIQETREMLKRAAVDIDEFLLSSVQFEIDIADVSDSPAGQLVVCAAYRQVFGRWS